MGDIQRVCSLLYETTVLNDNSVRLQARIIDMPAGPHGCAYAKARVEIRQLLDACWRVYHPQNGCIVEH